MNKIKLIAKLLPLFILFFVFAGNAFAATSIRLQQPQAQTYKDTFDITFVALDTNNSAINVQCYKKGPSDGSFVAFGSVINLAASGNTNVCQVNSSVITTDGIYQFKAVANGVDSNTVSVDRNGSIMPGAPTNYNKTKPDNCIYKIEFRTANDSGKTIKVVLYRSTETNFSVDSSHQVNSTNISSDTQGSMTDNVSPNCNTEYFYVIRAFDVYGNGSSVGGDSNVTTTIVNPTTTSSQAQGAINLGNTGESVLGAETKTPEKSVLGTESAKPSPSVSPEPTTTVGQNPIAATTNWVLTHKKISLLTLILLGGIGFYIYRKKQKPVN
jgi:hypothetical protein